MAEKGRQLLALRIQGAVDKIEYPHGIPDFPFVQPDQAKAKLGFSGRAVILTFGLLSPNKGVEVMIDAMPAILKRRADAMYVRPRRHAFPISSGPRARPTARASWRARKTRRRDHVVFLDQFGRQETLLDFISMCDVYVTPYLNESQMTFGHIGL